MFRVPPLTPRDAVRMLGCLAGIETKKEKTMPEETKNPWIEYSKGHWTREFPKEPGTYSVTGAGFDHEDPGNKVIHVVRLPSGELESFPKWRGWWWSVAIPSLPTVEQSLKEQQKS